MKFDFPAPGPNWFAAPERAAELGVAYLAYSPEAPQWFHPNVTVRSLTAARDASLDAIADRTASFEADEHSVRVIKREVAEGILMQSLEFPTVNPADSSTHLMQQMQVLVDARMPSQEEGQLLFFVLTALPEEIGQYIAGLLAMVEGTKLTAEAE